MRFGGVLVMMSSGQGEQDDDDGTATHSVASATSQEATSQPSTPPPVARARMPSTAWGWPPKMWQSALIDTSRRPRPMPMRVLSCTDDGCRNSQPAKRTMMTGRA